MRFLIGRCILLLAAAGCSSPVWAWKVCPLAEGGGVCPDHNTCCPTDIPGQSSCISVKEGEVGMCCADGTGCGQGYECRRRGDKLNEEMTYCHRIDPNDTDPEKPKELPRYKLCSLPPEVLLQPHTLSIHDSKTVSSGQLVYYSNRGSLEELTSSSIQNAVVVIHGSGRTAEDYLCSIVGSLPEGQQDDYLVVAPRFMAPEDVHGQAPDDENEKNILLWLEHGYIYHTWRYGADAINTTISSFMAMDQLLEQIVSLPSIRNIVVPGHSAGGQFVQRWALLTSDMERSSLHKNLHFVVANPRCFAMLDDRRLLSDDTTTVFEVPDADTIAACPDYNQWIWGLEDGGPLSPLTYRDRALDDVGGNTSQLVDRYIENRNTTYLAGGHDLHIYHDDCGSVLQGPTRKSRSEGFMKTLHLMYDESSLRNHRRVVAPGIPHDHTLLWQSPQGQRVLFGTAENHEMSAATTDCTR